MDITIALIAYTVLQEFFIAGNMTFIFLIAPHCIIMVEVCALYFHVYNLVLILFLTHIQCTLLYFVCICLVNM